MGAQTYIVWFSGGWCSWGAGIGGVLERLRFRPSVEDRNPHPATLGLRNGRQSERLPGSEKAPEGAGFAQSLLRGRRDRWTKLSGHTLPSRLGTLRSFRCFIPLDAYSALGPPTVTCTLLCLPPRLPAPAHKPAGTSLQSG